MRGHGKNLLLAAALVMAGVGAIFTPPAEARVAVSIYAPIAPPPLRVEIAPTLRAGYIWAPGYWGWRNHRYVWHRGHQIRARHGYRYVGPRWEHNGNRWRYHGERWGR